jgi:uncharacterized protein (TIGR03435 family)
VPEGTSKEQFHQMMQTLLAERFQLVLHHEQKEMPVLELTVAEKGSRLKAAGTARTEDDPWEITPYTVGKDGYPEFPAGRSGLAGADGRYRWTGYGVSMAEIVNTLSFHLGRPVVDATGLRGKLDVDLRWGIDVAPLTERAGPREQAGEMAESGAPGPALMRAVRDQLGLKLNSKKGLGDMVVIDHVEKVPSGN